MIGDGQRVAVFMIAQQKLALVIGPIAVMNGAGKIVLECVIEMRVGGVEMGRISVR